MLIRPSTKEQRKQIFLRALLNETDKVSKVSKHSVLSGVGQGIAAVAGKSEKDIFLAISVLYPDFAHDEQLDEAAELFGITSRLGSSKSSTYLLIFAEEGTQYFKGVHSFQSTEGVTFDLEQDVVEVGERGFIYVKVNSIDTGSNAVAEAGTITQMSQSPSGHRAVINEFTTMGGFDEESDDLFRRRIKEGVNILARGTLSAIEQAFKRTNPEVMRVDYEGINDIGQNIFRVSTQSGAELSNSEKQDLIDQNKQFFNLIDQQRLGRGAKSVVVKDADYLPIDISFRCRLLENVLPEEFSRRVQVKLLRFLDLRTAPFDSYTIQWTRLVEIIRNTSGVDYLPNRNFSPRENIIVPKGSFARIRGFRLLNLDGSIQTEFAGSFTPVFYPSEADFKFQNVLL